MSDQSSIKKRQLFLVEALSKSSDVTGYYLAKNLSECRKKYFHIQLLIEKRRVFNILLRRLRATTILDIGSAEGADLKALHYGKQKVKLIGLDLALTPLRKLKNRMPRAFM